MTTLVRDWASDDGGTSVLNVGSFPELASITPVYLIALPTPSPVFLIPVHISKGSHRAEVKCSSPL